MHDAAHRLRFLAPGERKKRLLPRVRRPAGRPFDGRSWAAHDAYHYGIVWGSGVRRRKWQRWCRRERRLGRSGSWWANPIRWLETYKLRREAAR